MKYWTIAFPGEYGQNVVETWSEDQIIESYYTYWKGKMIAVGKADEATTERCIEDWITVHWASRTDEFGQNIVET